MYRFYTLYKCSAIAYVFEFKPSDKLIPVICNVGASKEFTLNNIKDEFIEDEGYYKLAGINLSVPSQTSFGLAYNNGDLVIGNLDKLDHNGMEMRLSYSLVSNGKIDIQGFETFDNFNYKYPRTLIGKKKDGTIVLCSVDGRSKKSRGITAVESAQLMLDLGCVLAINANGDGHSQMIYKGKIINDYPKPYTRSISNALIVYSRDKINNETIAEYPVLRMWSKGDYVLILQQSLKAKGYNVNTEGVFDPQTYDAVIKYQKDKDVTENGIVDETIWEMLLL